MGLPQDIVAVDAGNKNYLFYVSANQQRLSYLVSPGADGRGNYTQQAIKDEDGYIQVNPKTQQVAALEWQEASGVTQIRVYYVKRDGSLSEVCYSSNRDGWYKGSLGLEDNTAHYVVEGSSISAAVHQEDQKKWNLRVFAAGKDQINKHLEPVVLVYKFAYEANGDNTGDWAAHKITNEIKGY